MNGQIDWTVLTDEERASLQKCEGFWRLSQTPEWEEIKLELGRWVGDAVRSLSDSKSSDPMVSHTLALTLQARSDTMALVIGMVENHVAERQRLIEAATMPAMEEE